MVKTVAAAMRVVMAASVATALGSMASTASAAPSERAAAGTAATVIIVAPEVLRVDKQEQGMPLVVFAGVDSQTRVRVNFGDGPGTDSRQGRCKISSAIAFPQSCTVELGNVYYAEGTYTITAIVGSTMVQKLITITPPPIRWAPPAGWVQPAGWSVLGRGAWYHACQNVEWYVDRALQPALGGQIVQDIPIALGMLAAESNLTFTETADPVAADLTFAWKETGAAGLGGGGKVWFDIDHRWVMDDWPGFGWITQPSGWRGAGHGLLVLHEVMHAMGFGHVDDRTSIMGSAVTIGPGDLDGLHTMYRDVPCPVG